MAGTDYLQQKQDEEKHALERASQSLVRLELEECSIEQVKSQVNKIQELMRDVMIDGQHYGVIPGCGDKPALLKPGAEKLGLTFNLVPKYEERRTDLPNGHREYEIKCSLHHKMTGLFFGQGVGACSTMESKYRYRTENTGKPVPKEYWAARDSSLIGGPTYSPRKVKGEWVIMHKVDHDNPADYYNTVYKMAKKRAHVDATLTALAASDIFTQDIDDDPPAEPINVTPEPEQRPLDATQPAPLANAPPAPSTQVPTEAGSDRDISIISERQGKRLYAIWNKAGWSDKTAHEFIFDNWGYIYSYDKSAWNIETRHYEAIVDCIENDRKPSDEELP